MIRRIVREICANFSAVLQSPIGQILNKQKDGKSDYKSDEEIKDGVSFCIKV